jgi:hypothetical protein
MCVIFGAEAVERLEFRCDYSDRTAALNLGALNGCSAPGSNERI